MKFLNAVLPSFCSIVFSFLAVNVPLGHRIPQTLFLRIDVMPACSNQPLNSHPTP